ncbi:unnamed protein product [Ceutorhynchus assimilis]|uniref:MAGE domain-containing protein n=1 Tax=Ceutorhynchus assimilis TaxID=467358 RepID=A0A9N9MN93_9CUCU|nr:unnamed protein product [Ceutorhynchus assimilis]
MSQSQRKSGGKSQTQLTLSQSFANVADPEVVIQNVVRYIIYRGGEHMNFTKAELVRNVILKPGGRFEEIMNGVREILEKVYGYSIMVCDRVKGKDKQYVVSNKLPYLNDADKNEEIAQDINKVLITLILSHILMSNNEVTDVSLYSFLKSVGIDVDLRHPIFGQVKESIKTLIKQQYLIHEINNISKREIYKWGLRAEKEISKHKILEFVCKMYKDRKVEDWTSQYQDAEEQGFENQQLQLQTQHSLEE